MGGDRELAAVADADTSAAYRPSELGTVRGAGPSRRMRVLAALLCAEIGFGLAYFTMSQRGKPGDFLYWYTAARALLAGQNPYDVIPAIDPHRFITPFFYPLPAAVTTIPFAILPYALGGACFVALSAGLLAYGATRDGWHRLMLFAGAPFTYGAVIGAWPPIVAAAALIPALGFLVVLKPNVGIASVVYRPSRYQIIGGAAVLLASLVVLPHWPIDWWRDISQVRSRMVPVLTPVGPLLLLACTRWRRPEGRLLLAYACVPQAPWFYDQIILCLIPDTWREGIVYALVTQLACVAWVAFRMLEWQHGAWFLAAVLYLPPLVMVLRRPNEGSMPAWVERGVMRMRALYPARAEPADARAAAPGRRTAP